MRNCPVALNNECFRFYKVVGDKEIDYSDRTKLPYVDATVMEIQRLANICELVIRPYGFASNVTIEGSNMIFHSLTFARSRGKC